MDKVYVHMLCNDHSGWSRWRSKLMVPVSYGPFKDDDEAREWIRRTGIITMTTLLSLPAKKNVNIPQDHFSSVLQ